PMNIGRGRLKGLRSGRSPDPVVGQRESNDGNDDPDDEPDQLAGHETPGQHPRTLQDPDRPGNHAQQAEHQTERSHVITVRADVSVFSCEREVALSRPASPQGEPPFRANEGGRRLPFARAHERTFLCASAPRTAGRRTRPVQSLRNYASAATASAATASSLPARPPASTLASASWPMLSPWMVARSPSARRKYCRRRRSTTRPSSCSRPWTPSTKEMRKGSLIRARCGPSSSWTSFLASPERPSLLTITPSA